MKKIRSGELYKNLNTFLKSRGIELTEGSYAQTVQKSCGLLTDAINLGQASLGRAKTEVDRRLDAMRQVIHEKTAPKPPPIPKPSGTGSKRRARGARKSRR